MSSSILAAGGGVEPPLKAFAAPLKPGLLPTRTHAYLFISSTHVPKFLTDKKDFDLSGPLFHGMSPLVISSRLI